MTERRVTEEQIDAILDECTLYVTHITDTTTMIAVVFDKDGFLLAIGHSACVDLANFDEEKGAKYACEDAMSKAREKLWELEGYKLAKSGKA